MGSEKTKTQENRYNKFQRKTNTISQIEKLYLKKLNSEAAADEFEVKFTLVLWCPVTARTSHPILTVFKF